MADHADNTCTMIRYIYSCILLVFSIALVVGLIFTEQTKIAHDVHPALAFCLLLFSITWLTMVEGGQGSLVGLAPVNRELYKHSHPLSYVCTSLCHKGDNLDRYLLGRQFMVVLVVFTVNNAGGPIGDVELWDLPPWCANLFFTTGLAMILLTCMVGQLNSQVNGCHCMLDYINNYFAVFTLYVAMAIEFSGLLHSSYLIQIAVAKLAGKPIISQEPPRSGGTALFFWARCLMSLAILCFCFAVTLTALFDGKTTIWESIPTGISVVIFVILLCVVGMLEGMQIAFFAVAKFQEKERGNSKFQLMTCELLFRNRGHNLAGFMIGRQLCVVSCMFFVARITSVQISEGESNIFDVPQGLQELFNTGLLGALIVTIVGSISWQLVASAFPLQFLANPLVYVLLRICLLLEATGLCSGAWVLAKTHKKIAGWKRDEVYIGTAEERAQKAMGDNSEILHTGAGHMVKLPLELPEFPAVDTRKYTLPQVIALEKDIRDRQQKIKERLTQLAIQKQKMVSGYEHEFVCTNCGNTHFEPEDGKFKCTSCGSDAFEISVKKADGVPSELAKIVENDEMADKEPV